MSAQRKKEEPALKNSKGESRRGEAAPCPKVGRGEPVTAFPYDKVKVRARKKNHGLDEQLFFFFFLS